MTTNELNAFLFSVCKGQKYSNFIDCYSEEIEEFLIACGYIVTEDEGIYKRIIATDKGRELFACGGFTEFPKPNPIGFTV